MGVLTYEHDLFSSIPPARLYKSFHPRRRQPHPLIANSHPSVILSGVFESVEILEGDGGAGTVKVFTFDELYQLHKSLKHRIDEIHKKNFVYKYTLIEGDILEDGLESISCVVKVEHRHHGGSVLKITSTYHPKKDHELHSITEKEEDYLYCIADKIERGKDDAKGILKAVEAHLHAHPHAYT